MCSPATCNNCGKASYTGCGQHVEQVLGHLPADQRCQCDAQPLADTLMGKLFGR
ncbi:hypothetical protein [Nocardioides sp. GY 10113]|uniref:hypothetical protein n=1 Tax=Nocardioides sp. GY 10113 TaxID=2569761 RepID=UPI0014587DC3|nr:hypothetical protein [Nocardioides sp. GY 10113]